MPVEAPTVEELLALDLLTLSEHTERAGDRLDPFEHAAVLRSSLLTSTTCTVRRDTRLVAYAMLERSAGTSWFARGFCIHPEHRGGPVLRELLRRVIELVRHDNIAELRSHVYRTNAASIAFHRRLGFEVHRENDRALEFVADATVLDHCARRFAVACVDSGASASGSAPAS